MAQARKKTKSSKSTKSSRKTRTTAPRKRLIDKAPKMPEQEEIGLARESTTVVLLVLAIFLGLSLYSYLVPPAAEEAMAGFRLHTSSNIMGRVGLLVAEGLIVLLGWCSFVTVLWALILARTVWFKGWPARTQSFFSFLVSTGASILMAASCAGIASVLLGYEGGGKIGSLLAFTLIRYVNEAGALLLCGAVFLLCLGIGTGLGTSQLVQLLRRGISLLAETISDSWYVLVTFSRGALRMSGLTGTFFGKALARFFLGLASIFRFFYQGAFAFRDRRREVSEKNETVPPPRIPEIDDRPANDEFVLGYPLPEEESGERFVKEPIISRHQNEQDKKSSTSVRPLKKNKKALAAEAKRNKKAPDTKSKNLVKDYKDFILPRPDLLVSSESSATTGPNDKDLIKNSKKLEQALRNFRIGGRVTEVHPGPVVTLYQFEPAAGIKVQRIVNLADDLALALKVGSVRVFAPVPGKGTIGIEVPNAQREMVRLREIVESDLFISGQAPLLLAYGKDTYGDPSTASLAKMPHLLIAGATGTGKSVCINSLLISLLFKNTPEDLQLVLIDPKMLELSVYEDIPHLKVPVITMPKRARGALWWAVQEMERRYQLMKSVGVRDISMYNRTIGKNISEERRSRKGKREKQRTIELEEKDVIATGSPYEGLERGTDVRVKEIVLSQDLEKLPRIVIVVDELADLMFTVGREIEELLTRLAQKARAAGIHLILATQRPSVNVITGLIKANFPARISFKVATKIDARTVMDSSGAEKLLGQGDFLYMSPGTGGIKRLHAPYISDNEVHDVVAWLKEQEGPSYDVEIEKTIKKLDESEASGGGSGDGEDEYDPLYDQAVSAVIEKGQASTSMVQRIFRIGYNRAARILETMEREGVVGPADGAKPRPVLVGGRGDPVEHSAR